MSESELLRPDAARPARARPSVKTCAFGVACLVVCAATLEFGIGYFRCAHANAQVQSTISEISMIIGGARQSYGQYGFSGLTTAVAIGARVIPVARAASGSMTATNGYAGALTLVDNSAKIAGTAMLGYTKVPSAQCAQIVAAVRPLTRAIDVQGARVTHPDGTIIAATLDARCASAVDVKIDFVFGRI